MMENDTPASFWTRFLATSFVNGAATLGPLGYWTKAPGTVGSVAGLLWFTVAFYHVDMLTHLLLVAFTSYLAMCLCGESEVRMMKRDPGCIILDEFVAVPLCFLGVNQYLIPGELQAPLILLAGFVLFRVFDILKPFGIKRLQKMPGGVGVVVDDLAAALATAVVLNIALMMLSN